MIKIMLGGIISLSFLFSGTTEIYNNLAITDREAVMKEVERFKNFNNTKIIPLSKDNPAILEFNKYKENYGDDLEKKLKEAEEKFPEKGDTPMSKKEFQILSKKVLQAKKELVAMQVQDYVLYLMSETVPEKSYQDFLLSMGILRKNGVRINTKQYLVGVPKDSEKYLKDMFHRFSDLPMKDISYIKPSLALKFDPRLYDYFEIKQVPVMIYATCKGVPAPERCEFKYMIRGDVSLAEFFETIADKTDRKDFKKYHSYLIGNKIVTKEDNL